jgi:O-antigen ligase
MDLVTVPQRRSASAMPAGVGVAIALALPMVGAINVAGIYLDKEFLVVAAWVAFGIAALVFVQPLVGVGVMTATFMLVAYPTLLQNLGFLTINNLLGLCLGAVLAAQILTTRDLSVLKLRPVLLFAAIGVVLILSTAHADAIFPTMRASQSLGVKGKALDRTADMMHDYWVRLIFLVFFCAFVRTGRDVRAMFYTFVLVLFLAVPSALINWWNGTLSHAFRTEASVTAGSNPNRLAMICLMEIACWWCWVVARRGALRWVSAGVAIGGALLVVLASGSRSGFLGCLVLGLLLQSGPRRYRLSVFQLGMITLVGAIAVATVVPPEAWERMLAFSPDNPHAGSTMSIVAREQTIDTGLQMIRDHFFLGIGIGNFREVARQIYLDPFFRPPHNSYLWAATEGGIFVLAGYLVLFWVVWRDLAAIRRMAERDPACAWVIVSMRNIFYLYSFFAAFADLWLNPITYFLVASIVCLRRHLESLPPAAAGRRLEPALARAA